MSQDTPPSTPDNPSRQSKSLAITVALIGAVGLIIAAGIGSIDKIIDLIATEEPLPPTSHTTTLINTPAFTPLETKANAPAVFDFHACIEPCDGTNHSEYFPEGIEKIYLQWSYENIPIGSIYTRIWKNNGREWIRYECQWTGPENDTKSTSLREPGGFHSGIWEVNILVDNKILLNEEFSVYGSWDYWSPAGQSDTCY